MWEIIREDGKKKLKYCAILTLFGEAIEKAQVSDAEVLLVKTDHTTKQVAILESMGCSINSCPLEFVTTEPSTSTSCTIHKDPICTNIAESSATQTHYEANCKFENVEKDSDDQTCSKSDNDDDDKKSNETKK